MSKLSSPRRARSDRARSTLGKAAIRPGTRNGLFRELRMVGGRKRCLGGGHAHRPDRPNPTDSGDAADLSKPQGLVWPNDFDISQYVAAAAFAGRKSIGWGS